MHDSRKAPRVIHFRVIAHHQINFLRIDQLADPGNQFVSEILFHRIDEGNFFIHDDIGIVGRPLIGGIAMKVSDIPINDRQTVNPPCNLNGLHLENSSSAFLLDF